MVFLGQSKTSHMHMNVCVLYMYRDFEITAFYPFVDWLAAKDKHWIHRWFSPLYSHVFFFFVGPIQYLIKLINCFIGNERFSLLEDSFPLWQLLAFVTFSSEPLGRCINLWLVIHGVCAYYLVVASLIGTHHHTSVYHAGDHPREEKDWGLYQMDATNDLDKRALGGLLLVAASFGDHLMHHMFPTVDHSRLNALYPALAETCTEFGVKTPVFGQISIFAKEMHLQLARNEPNTFEQRKKMKP
jgi:fatty acid desaturase